MVTSVVLITPSSPLFQDHQCPVLAHSGCNIHFCFQMNHTTSAVLSMSTDPSAMTYNRQAGSYSPLKWHSGYPETQLHSGSYLVITEFLQSQHTSLPQSQGTEDLLCYPVHYMKRAEMLLEPAVCGCSALAV